MQRSQKFANPFYGLLLVAGIVFAITAICYGVMAFRDARPAPQAVEADAQNPRPEHPLMAWMRRHGDSALMAELVFLAIFTFGAIATDSFWQRRAAERNNGPSSPSPFGRGPG